MYEDDDKKTPVFPRHLGVIPTFTVVDVVVAPTHNQTDGWACKLARMTLHESSLYSYMTPTALDLLPHSEAEALQFYEAMAPKCEKICNVIERTRQCFYAPLTQGSFLAEMPLYPDYFRVACNKVYLSV